jgi:hypothetical protein
MEKETGGIKCESILCDDGYWLQIRADFPGMPKELFEKGPFKTKELAEKEGDKTMQDIAMMFNSPLHKFDTGSQPVAKEKE